MGNFEKVRNLTDGNIEKARKELIKIGEMIIDAENSTCTEADKVLMRKITDALRNCSEDDLDFLEALTSGTPEEEQRFDEEFNAGFNGETGFDWDRFADENAPEGETELSIAFETELDKFGLA